MNLNDQSGQFYDTINTPVTQWTGKLYLVDLSQDEQHSFVWLSFYFF